MLLYCIIIFQFQIGTGDAAASLSKIIFGAGLIGFVEVWLDFSGGLGQGMSGSDRDFDEVEAKFEYGTWVFGLR